MRAPPHQNGEAVIYLIVGLDRNTFAQWHQNVMAGDVADAVRIARARARAQRVNLVVAAVIGTYSTVLDLPVDETAAQEAA
jgi:hypothetical protein